MPQSGLVVYRVYPDPVDIMHINKADCVDILESKLGNTSFQLEDFSVKYFEELMGFHANHAGLTIKAIVDGEMKDYKFFLKTSTENPLIKEKYWNVLRQFYKEHVFMTGLQKVLQRFVEKKITADCYLSKLERIAVLEDLCTLGYRTPKTLMCDWHHAEKAVEAFANLHAASILYEEKTGVIIEEKYKDINYESLLFETDKHPREFLLYSLDQGVRAVVEAYFENVSPDLKDEIFSKVRRRTTEVQKHNKKYRKVVCQGDPWGNNLLYKYSNEGKPVDAILVDFGCLRIAPPAMDVMQFLYLGATNDFRKKFKAQIKDTYYDHFSRILSDNGVDPENVLPRKQFLESCEVYEEFGLCCRIYYEYVTRLPGEYLLQASTSPDKFLGLMARGDPELALDAFQKHEAYRKGLTEAIEDAIRFYKSK